MPNKYLEIKQCISSTTNLNHSIPHKVIFESFKLKLKDRRKINK